MDKNAIKKYAVWARRELISRVSQKALQYGITESEIVDASADSVNGKLLSAEEKNQRAALIQEVRENGYEQVMEEVAYTWFNRFCALRFMEVNGYLPSHIRVFSDDENNFKPQILTEAINLNLPGLNLEKVYTLKSEDRNEELFKYLLIVQCNALNAILPGMFQKIADYTELLFPDNLLREGSVVEQLVSQIPEEDWKDAVQIIGWLYQFYNIEPKEKVFADLKKNIKISKDKIPAATQQFTPDWIVRYMVENSLGRLWAEGHPKSTIKGSWRYYLEEAEQEESVKAQLDKIRLEYAKLQPKDIKCIDPCMGSGHILVYMFDILVQIYGDYGYNARDSVEMIVRNNLYGLDIDDRAAQLAYFAVMMKACQYDRRFLERGVQPQIFAIQESNTMTREAFDYIVGGNENLRSDLQKVVDVFHDAKEYGSILQMPAIDFEALYSRFDEIFDDISLYQREALEIFLPLVKQAEVLAQKYDIVVTNPPYMGSSGMDAKLSDYVKTNFTDSKSDLFAVFIEQGNSMLKYWGFNCMVTMQSWMFLSGFEKMRSNILNKTTITNLMHMENMVLGIAFGTAVTNYRRIHITNYKGTYNQIKLCDIENNAPKTFPIQGNRFAQISTENFSKIPGSPIAYWVGDGLISIFSKSKSLEQIAHPKKGLATTDNNRFLRFWYEVSFSKVGIGFKDRDEARISRNKWFPLNKGGEYRRWFGNILYVINWEDDGKEMKTAIVTRYNGGSYTKEIRSEDRYFSDSITWSALTSGKTSFRYSNYGALFDSAGSSMFPCQNRYYILGFLNSRVADSILSAINPTLNYGAGSIGLLPLIEVADKCAHIELKVEECIANSKTDWDSFETSWDFKKHPLI